MEENQTGSLLKTPFQDDSTLDAVEAKNHFWTITRDFICRHHVEPRVKLYVPKEEPLLSPMKYIDDTRKTHTSLDVISDASKRKEEQKWVIEKPKLDNARRLRGIFFIEPDDEEFTRTMKTAGEKLEIPMPATMPCKTSKNGRGETKAPKKQRSSCTPR